MNARAANGHAAAQADALRRLTATMEHTSGDAGTVAGASRRVIGAHLVAVSARDDGVLDDALDLAHTARLDLAAAPAASIDDVRTKLAHLVKVLMLVPDGQLERETETLALAAGALADLILLRDGSLDRSAEPIKAVATRPRTPAERLDATRRAAERKAGL